MATPDPLTAPIPGASHRDVGGMSLDIAPAGNARVKRMIYPAGFRWSTHMKAVAGTETCEHTHVGFLARGELFVEFPDGRRQTWTAPAVVAIAPGHDAGVGKDGAVFIEFDFERNTAATITV